jgi:glutamine cyclotransferase
LSVIAISLIFVSACNSEKKEDSEQVLPFTITNENDLQGKLGKEIVLNLQVNEKVTILHALAGKDTLKTWKNVSGSLSYTFNTSLSGIGKHDVKFICSLDNGKVFDQTITVEVLSDKAFNLLEATILSNHPHMSSSFTQGLEFDGENLYEGTGDPSYTGATFVAQVDLNTGKQKLKQPVPTPNFGEGITILNGKLYQLTWQQQKCFIYDKNSLKKIGEFTYEGEGWGLCNDGDHLIMSNGTSTLVFRDPETFKVIKTIQVATDKSSVSSLNELEYVDGLIYANIWQEDVVVSIEPSTGRVIDLINCFALVNQVRAAPNQANPRPEVLNGIAYKKSTKTFFLTGKYWPTIFEVMFTRKNS